MWFLNAESKEVQTASCIRDLKALRSDLGTSTDSTVSFTQVAPSHAPDSKRNMSNPRQVSHQSPHKEVIAEIQSLLEGPQSLASVGVPHDHVGIIRSRDKQGRVRGEVTRDNTALVAF